MALYATLALINSRRPEQNQLFFSSVSERKVERNLEELFLIWRVVATFSRQVVNK